MQQLFLSAMEKAVNQYLRLDPETITRIAELEGKVIQVELTDWSQAFYILPLANGLQFLSEYHTDADTVIKGKLSALTRSGLASGSTKSVKQNNIEISGDLDTGEKMREIMQSIDIDWEEHLAKLIGDSGANTFMSIARDLRSGFAESMGILRQKASEYLHQEAQILPTSNEVEQFCQDVATTRDAVARAEARLKQLFDDNDAPPPSS